MPYELIIGLGVGVAIFLIFLVLRSFMSPKEIEMSSYSPPAPYASTTQDSNAALSGDFSLTIEDTFSIKGRGLVVTGRVASGSLRLGQRVSLTSPGSDDRIESTVKGIESFRKVMQTAKTGDNIGILLAGLTKEQVKKGMVISALS